MNHDIRPSWRRTWAERHPVLSECIAIAVMTIAVVGMAYLSLYAVT